MRKPAIWKGTLRTSTADESTPHHASHAGIIRPRSRRYEKIVLPTAKKIAPTGAPGAITNAPSAFVIATSEALTPVRTLASHSSPWLFGISVAMNTPSATRHRSASIASSWSSSRVIPYKATASTKTEKHSPSFRMIASRTSVE